MSGGGPGCSPLDGSAVPSATLFERAVGRTIDASVAIVLELVAMVPFSLLLWLAGWGSDWGYGAPSHDGQGAIRTLLWLIPTALALAWVLYETVSTWSGGQTVGKRAAGTVTALANRRRRGLHDVLAGTVVVQKPTNQGTGC